ncbi:MAG: hydroxypyruvate isomerase, partial [Bacteroidetes bacterium]|nr:hydroxypyruvate isomerase [Bacteroidota bacterium]
MLRRKFISKAATSGLLITSIPSLAKSSILSLNKESKGTINHSVCHWCFEQIPLEDFLITLRRLGIGAIDLVGPKDWPLLKKHNIHCSMCNGAELGLTKGFNNPKYHKQLIENYSRLIPMVAQAGYNNLICFSGNREGMSDEEGLANCVAGLSKILPIA